MTETDISPEAVERLACILEGRGGFVKDSTITATLRALSAALTLHQNDANYQCRERVKEWERANAAELALTKSRAETAAAYERAAGVLDTHGDSAATEALGARLCCNGDMCGCRGADVGSYLQHLIRALTTPEQSSALAAIEAAAEARGMRKAAEIAQLNAWCHQGVDAYSQGMDAGARHQCKVINDAILAAIPQGDTTND